MMTRSLCSCCTCAFLAVAAVMPRMAWAEDAQGAAAASNPVSTPAATATTATTEVNKDDAPFTRRFALPVGLLGLAILPAGILGLLAGVGSGTVGAAGTIITPRWGDGAPKPFPGEPVDVAQARIWIAFGLLVLGPALTIAAILPVVLAVAHFGGAVALRILPPARGANQEGSESKRVEPALAAKTQTPPPDPDGDGVMDAADQCPDQPGAADNNGCPWGDADADTVTDNVDKCPDQAGATDNNGCPWGDADADTVTDNVDKCPDQVGATDNNGCPWGDADTDTVLDNVDRCPQQAGPVDNGGCPWGNADNDDLADNIDRCPLEAGPVDNGGCPRPVEATQTPAGEPPPGTSPPPPEPPKVVDPRCMDPNNLAVVIKDDQVFIPTKIQFAPGTARILAQSKGLLDQVALTLKCRVDIKLMRIDGHTDSQGSKQLNQKLSAARAKSVRDYLIQKAKIDPARLEAKGHGPDSPMASNDTEEGREKNRRVEFVIVEMSR